MRAFKPVPIARVTRASVSARIRRGACVLPLKSMLCALSYAAPRFRLNSNANSIDLTRHIAVMGSSLSEMQNGKDVDPELRYERINDALADYVRVFYTVGESRCSKYLQRCAAEFKRIPTQNNLLAISAIMALQGEASDHVASMLSRRLYAMPVTALHKAGRTIRSIELLEQSMAIKSMPMEAIDRFSASIKRLELKRLRIYSGKITPVGDEQLIDKFIEEAAALSAHGTNVLGILEEIVGTTSTYELAARRLVRK